MNDITPTCKLCIHAKELQSGDILCPIKGIVSKNYSCRRYQYNIFLRPPARKRTIDSSNFKPSDFRLD